jgi:hypothetical protein
MDLLQVFLALDLVVEMPGGNLGGRIGLDALADLVRASKPRAPVVVHLVPAYLVELEQGPFRFQVVETFPHSLSFFLHGKGGDLCVALGQFAEHEDTRAWKIQPILSSESNLAFVGFRYGYCAQWDCRKPRHT